MQENNFTGIWDLDGSFDENGEFEIIEDEEEYRRIYEQWLRDEDYENLENLNKADGLRLEINADGTFTETKTGNPQIEWFDEEGVLVSKITPFDGIYKIFDDRAFLTLPNPPYLPDTDDPERIRCDDGDTKICDSLRIIGEDLVRTVSVITDELYTTRVLLRYTKSSVT
jgi:hypothetical protein